VIVSIRVIITIIRGIGFEMFTMIAQATEMIIKLMSKLLIGQNTVRVIHRMNIPVLLICVFTSGFFIVHSENKSSMCLLKFIMVFGIGCGFGVTFFIVCVRFILKTPSVSECGAVGSAHPWGG
jgi:hypothetical protein